MRKRWIALLLACALCSSLTACGGQTAPDAAGGQDESKVEVAPPQAAPDTPQPAPDDLVDTPPVDDPAQSDQTAPETPPAAGAPVDTPATPAPTPAPTPTPAPAPAPEPAPAPTAAQAAAYIGGAASVLESALGAPRSKSYAPSCLGEGEDGSWAYDGFTVYTFRSASGAETVEAVQ